MDGEFHLLNNCNLQLIEVGLNSATWVYDHHLELAENFSSNKFKGFPHEIFTWLELNSKFQSSSKHTATAFDLSWGAMKNPFWKSIAIFCDRKSAALSVCNLNSLLLAFYHQRIKAEHHQPNRHCNLPRTNHYAIDEHHDLASDDWLSCQKSCD